MICQVIGIAMMVIEVFHEFCVAAPDEHSMLRVAEMVCQTASKVSSTQDENFRDMSGGRWLRIHWEIQRLSESGFVTTRASGVKSSRMGKQTAGLGRM